MDGAAIVALEELMEIEWSVWSENIEVALLFNVVHKTKKGPKQCIHQRNGIFL